MHWTFPEGQQAERDQSLEKKPHQDGEQVVCPSLNSLFLNRFFSPDCKGQMCSVTTMQKDENEIEITQLLLREPCWTFGILTFHKCSIVIFVYIRVFSRDVSDILGWRILYCGGLSWEHLCLLPARCQWQSLLPPRKLWQLKMSPDLARCPWGAELPRLRSTGVHLYIFAFLLNRTLYLFLVSVGSQPRLKGKEMIDFHLLQH